MGIGFASEYSDVSYGFPGWSRHPFSMGYHNDNGCMFESSGSDESSKGTGRFYQEGDVVGCGISWKEESVYYTVNGERIGKRPLPPLAIAYPSCFRTFIPANVCLVPGKYQTKLTYRKLYPVVSISGDPCTFR